MNEPASFDNTRRDRWGRYLVIPPEGGKPVGYTRATTIAKTTDSEGGLIPWKATLTVVGTLRRPGIHAKWQQLIAANPDPWYDSDASKAQCKQLVEEASTAGGSTDRADIGTALHALVETSLRDGIPTGLDPVTLADLEAFHTTIGNYGIVIDTGYLEAMVVNDTHRVAGRADMLRVVVPGYGPMIADLKTGSSIAYSAQSFACQLAIYAHADSVYEQGDRPDGSQDRRSPMPDVSHTHGLIVHLPAGEARCELHVVDITAGWEAVRLSFEVRSWRARKDLLTRLAPSTPVGLSPAEQLAHIPTCPDEGAEVSDLDYETLKQRYQSVAVDVRAGQYARYVRQAQQAGVSFHLAERRTVRRYEIARGLLILAEANSLDDDTIRALTCHPNLADETAWFPAVTVGHLVGSLDAGQALIFSRRCDALVGGQLVARVDAAGHVSLHPAA